VAEGDLPSAVKTGRLVNAGFERCNDLDNRRRRGSPGFLECGSILPSGSRGATDTDAMLSGGGGIGGRVSFAAIVGAAVLLLAPPAASGTPAVGIAAQTLSQQFMTAVASGSYAHSVPAGGAGRDRGNHRLDRFDFVGRVGSGHNDLGQRADDVLPRGQSDDLGHQSRAGHLHAAIAHHQQWERADNSHV